MTNRRKVEEKLVIACDKGQAVKVKDMEYDLGEKVCIHDGRGMELEAAVVAFSEESKVKWAVLSQKMVQEKLYTVRLYDAYEHRWMDLRRNLTNDEAKALWNKKTKNGTKHTEYLEGTYYEIFPSNTRMIFS